MTNEQNERLARRNDWFLRGWEQVRTTDAKGRTKTDLVYTGEYYDFPVEAPRLQIKVTLGVCLVVLLGFYFPMSLGPALGNRTFYVNAPCFLAIIPLLYAGIGIFWLLVTPGAMTYRRLHVSARRLELACMPGMLLMGITAAAQTFCMIRSFSEISLFWDFFLLFGSVISGGQYAIAYKLMKKYPMSVCPEDKAKLDKTPTL